MFEQLIDRLLDVFQRAHVDVQWSPDLAARSLGEERLYEVERVVMVR
jgi:hypothetical protein